MPVWFHPVNAPDVYVVVRLGVAATVICISDGLRLDRAAAAFAALCTVAERDWVRERMGSPPVAVDPTYAHIDEIANGSPVWHRSMIPDGLLWEGKVPCGEHQETTEREVASDRPSS